MPVARNTCTPADKIAVVPCLQCLSDSELQMLEMWAWAAANGINLSGGLDGVLTASACWSCLSDTQRYRLYIQDLISIFGGDASPESAIEALNCLRCLKPGQVKAAIAYLQCLFASQGQI